jgi:hypothetical protein
MCESLLRCTLPVYPGASPDAVDKDRLNSGRTELRSERGILAAIGTGRGRRGTCPRLDAVIERVTATEADDVVSHNGGTGLAHGSTLAYSLEI